MQIYINQEKIEHVKNGIKANEILDLIERSLIKMNLQFSHMIIDGKEICDDYYNYILENVDSIKELRVIANSLSSVVSDVLITAYNYVSRGGELIKDLSEEYYRQPGESAWSQLNDLFEGVQWIIETLSKIDSIKNLNDIVGDYNTWNEYVQVVATLEEIVPEFEKAMKDNDNILIGDLLMYEMVPLFENMSEKLALLAPEAVNGRVS